MGITGHFGSHNNCLMIPDAAFLISHVVLIETKRERESERARERERAKESERERERARARALEGMSAHSSGLEQLLISRSPCPPGFSLIFVLLCPSTVFGLSPIVIGRSC